MEYSLDLRVVIQCDTTRLEKFEDTDFNPGK